MKKDKPRFLFLAGISVAIVFGVVLIIVGIGGYKFVHSPEFLKDQASHFKHQADIAPLIRGCPAQIQNMSDDQSQVVPAYSEAQVVAWSQSVIPAIMDFGYQDFQEKLLAERKDFTPDGWCKFMEALEEANILQAMAERQLKLNLVLLNPPVVKRSFVEKGIYVWQVEAPISIEFKTDTNFPAPQNIRSVLTIKISQMPLHGGAQGMGISQWVTTTSPP